jgi:hypothetical protein
MTHFSNAASSWPNVKQVVPSFTSINNWVLGALEFFLRSRLNQKCFFRIVFCIKILFAFKTKRNRFIYCDWNLFCRFFCGRWKKLWKELVREREEERERTDKSGYESNAKETMVRECKRREESANVTSKRTKKCKIYGKKKNEPEVKWWFRLAFGTLSLSLSLDGGDGECWLAIRQRQSERGDSNSICKWWPNVLYGRIERTLRCGYRKFVASWAGLASIATLHWNRATESKSERLCRMRVNRCEDDGTVRARHERGESHSQLAPSSSDEKVVTLPWKCNEMLNEEWSKAPSSSWYLASETPFNIGRRINRNAHFNTF